MVKVLLVQIICYLLSRSTDNLTYSAMLNASYFGWASYNNYEFQISVFDRAMNQVSSEYNIWVDDIPPEINITEFKSNGIYISPEELNITTSDLNISIGGVVNDSAMKHICLNVSSDATSYPEITCQYPCLEGQTSDCITEDNLFTFNFTMSFDSYVNQGGLVWNYINLVATDDALNKEQANLTALLDLEPPTVIGVFVDIE